ncbi:MAG: hypothetical protein MJZ92_00710 [Paludibacteraceae bacterium]|nr:hypothetical protein [Paludibacteraceae bacterium]
MKKAFLYGVSALLIMLIIVGFGWWLYFRSLYKSYQSESVIMHHVAGDSLNTNSIASFTEQEIAIYGKWADYDKTLAYTMFMLEDAGDGFYWGKEWNEQDGVLEEDLDEHGNGWFRWRVKKDKILLIYNSTIGFVMPVEYSITQLNDTVLGMKNAFRRTPQSFVRRFN